MIPELTDKQQPKPRNQPIGNAPLGTNTNIVAASQRPNRHKAYQLLAHAQKLLIEKNITNTKGGSHRTRSCFAARHYNAETISLKLTSDPENSIASLGGIQTCGSVWSCPVCAKRIAVQRGKEISKAIAWATETDHIPIMMTLTASHNQGMSLASFKQAFKASWRNMSQSRRWRSLKAQLQIEHTIKAVEVTNGVHGWHYHYHALLFVPKSVLAALPQSTLEGWVEGCRDLWLHALSRNELSGIGEYALNVKYDGKVAENYLSKLGLTEDDKTDTRHELSGNANKNGKGLTVWAILRKSADGWMGYERLYTEYAESMQGENWITWSHGFKALANVLDIDDTTASEDENNDAVVFEAWIQLTDEQYRPVRRFRAYAELLEIAAATRDKDAVLDFLRDLEQRLYDLNRSQEDEIEDLRQQYSCAHESFERLRKIQNKKWSDVNVPYLDEAHETKIKIKHSLDVLGVTI